MKGLSDDDISTLEAVGGVPERCRERSDSSLCPREGVKVTLPCPEGRSAAVGGPFCEEHGGIGRARIEAGNRWNYLAPASVGDEAAVGKAGHWNLDDTHFFIILRQELDHWLATLGTRKDLRIPNPHGSTARSRKAERLGILGPHEPGYGFPSQEAALDEAKVFWRRRVDLEIDRIRAARGGTLGWGEPVLEPREPVVCVAERGESSALAIQRTLAAREA